MNYLEKLKFLNRHRSEGKNAERICSELTYLDGISKNKNGKYDKELEAAADYLIASVERDGVITKSVVLAAEEMLSDLAPVAKSYKRCLFLTRISI